MSNILHETTPHVNIGPGWNLADGIAGEGFSASRRVTVGQPPAATKGENPRYDPSTTLRALEVLMPGDTVLEMRAFRSRFSNGYIVPADFNTTLSGWYCKPHDLTVDANRARETSLYLTFNPVDPDLLARSANRMQKSTSATKDEDIIALRFWYTDIDPIRKTDISATDAERAVALGRQADILAAYPGLAECSLWGSSGNGAYILARLPDFPNDEEHRGLIAKATAILGHLYSDKAVEIDQKTKNPSRVFCLPGSMKCKGSNIPHRPWRPVTVEGLPVAGRIFDLAGFVAEHAERLPKETARVAVAVRSSVPADPASPALGGFSGDRESRAYRLHRASRYLDTKEPAISGQGGHAKTFDAACVLVKGFDLPPHEAKPILAEWNKRCDPPWTDAELDHKLTEADEKPDDKPRGYLFDAGKPSRPAEGGEGTADAEAPELPCLPGYEEDSADLARRFRRKHYDCIDGPKIRFWNGEFHEYSDGAWRVKGRPELHAELNAFMDDQFEKVHAFRLMAAKMKSEGKDGDETKMPRKINVTTPAVANATQALSGQVMLKSAQYPKQPCWLDGYTGHDPKELLIMRNAIVHIPSYYSGLPCVQNPTPRQFNSHCLQYGWQPDARKPERWHRFLREVFPGDQESIDTLQEWIGLQLVPVTKYQKMMAFIGQSRGGKGTIAKVMKGLVGEVNYCGPTLSSLSEKFGLQSLIGKLSAIIDDARLSGKSDHAEIAERLLSISGEGTLDVRRMHRPQWTGVLSCRVTLLSNELPRVEDAAGALPKRFLLLRFSQSFEGREDLNLDADLAAELPGILLWALEGLKRLEERGRFIQPKSGLSGINEMKAASLPAHEFVEDCCEVGPGLQCDRDDVYRAWMAWREKTGKAGSTNVEKMVREIRAVAPSVEAYKRKSGGSYVRVLKGMDLLPPDAFLGDQPY